ncbi:MAG: Hsp20/alpha crystallin family protein [Gaiellaceae bacterium]
MAIVKWAPFSELDSVERRMRRLVDELGFAQSPLPSADAYETRDEFVVELEVPGYEEKELTIEVADHTLAIRGVRKTTKDEEQKQFSLHERLERTFERRFVLPAEAEIENVKAVFSKGVLEVHAPKTKTTEPRQVAITKR